MIISKWILLNCYKNRPVQLLKDFLHEDLVFLKIIIKALIRKKDDNLDEYCLLKTNVQKYIERKDEFVEEKSFMRENKLQVFNYEFVKKYHCDNIGVFLDKVGRPYVLQNNKKLYFKKFMTPREIRNYYNGILIEQDKLSPHNYHTKEIFELHKISKVADVGAAEGFWGLDFIDKIDRLYLFECDKDWIEALEKTYEDYREKVVIVSKYVSSKDDFDNIRLDTFFNNEQIDALKADIEGDELDMLAGSYKTIKNLKSARICTYHRAIDAEEINKFMIAAGFTTRFTDGYMLFLLDKTLKEPYFRKGVLIADKIN